MIYFFVDLLQHIVLSLTVDFYVDVLDDKILIQHIIISNIIIIIL